MNSSVPFYPPEKPISVLPLGCQCPLCLGLSSPNHSVHTLWNVSTSYLVLRIKSCTSYVFWPHLLDSNLRCFWTVVLEKTLKGLLDCKKIKPVNPKGNQSWIFIGRTDAEAPILWPPDVKNRLTGKDPDAGKDWRQEEKGMTEDEMVGWHHQLYGREFERAPGVGDEQGSLECCSPWGHKG